MNPIQRFALRMTLATLAVATIASAFVVGYGIGYGEALREFFFQPAVIVRASD